MTRLLLPFAALLIVAGSTRSSVAADEVPRWESHIRPLLSERCGRCHSKTVQKAALDLSSVAGLQRGGESGEPLLADVPDDSLLWQMIDSATMPPDGEPPLTADEREQIRRWLLAGDHTAVIGESQTRILNQHDVLPILLLRCTACHGAERQDGGLDLRTMDSLRSGGITGPVIVPGNAADSLLIRRIENEQCPPSELLLRFFVERPASVETKTLRDWIDAGAVEQDVLPDVATTDPDPLVTDEDRQHWAFQPPQKAPGRHTVDEFVGRRLRENGLDFAPQADRDVLIRRAYLDLTGLPPSPDEWAAWHHDTRLDWFAHLVDSLLESPRYGERWGRYWLDVAGYADSEGGISADPLREVAWKYRDWVIDAFNSDKPYDRFLLEQIAGDELVDFQHEETISEDIVDKLIATGFLRMGIDQTGSRTMNFVPERLGVISDAISVVSSGVMGLTMECARCHSHKYDPIPQRDYYRFKAIFQGALDEHDWLTFRTRELDVATESHRRLINEINPPLLAELKRLANELKNAEADRDRELLTVHHPELTADEKSATLAALRIADNNRTQPQRLLVEKLQQAQFIPDRDQPASVQIRRQRVADLQQRMRSVRSRLVPPTTIRALWDRGRPSPTWMLVRGEHNRPGHLVGPGVPSVLTDGKTPFDVRPPFPDGRASTGRRLALAQWLIQPNHPLTARVMVNRIWFHHFGTGLVRTLDNFGRQGERPSHPELLDWLATEFIHSGWSIRHVHRLILNSRTWQQTSVGSAVAQKADPENRWLSHMSLRRMDAEALHDSLLFVCGRLDLSPGGPPDDIAVDQDGLVSILPTESGNWRRSVYAQFRRTELPTMMDTFDYPEMGPNCVERNVSTVAPQSLLLWNGTHVRELSESLAARVEAATSIQSPDDRRAVIRNVCQIALSRDPDETELMLGINSLQSLTAKWNGDSRAALVTYCHTILNTADFLYID